MTPPTITPEHRSFAFKIPACGTHEDAALLIAERDQEIISHALSEQAQQIDLESFPQILRDAAAERRRQVDTEKFNLLHDDQHVGGELALAAACYAIPPWFRFEFGGIFNLWPWHRTWWKPAREETNRRREIVKAIALLVAEDERLGRLLDNEASAKNEEGFRRFS